MRRREWLGSWDELRDKGDADTINSVRDPSDPIHTYGDPPNATDPDCHRVPNDNRDRGIPTTSHHNELQ
jgi:hypothetical protein